MLVDFIERGTELSHEGWKPALTEGSDKKQKITSFLPETNLKNSAQTRFLFRVKNCKLEDCLPLVTDPELRTTIDSQLESVKLVKSLPLNTKLLHLKFKTNFLRSPQDQVLLCHTVRFKDKAWVIDYSVDDDDTPLQKGVVRSQVNSLIYHFKPDPEIHGYTVIVEQDVPIADNENTSAVQNAQLKAGVKTWEKFLQVVAKAAKVRSQIK